MVKNKNLFNYIVVGISALAIVLAFLVGFSFRSNDSTTTSADSINNDVTYADMIIAPSCLNGSGVYPYEAYTFVTDDYLFYIEDYYAYYMDSEFDTTWTQLDIVGEPPDYDFIDACQVFKNQIYYPYGNGNDILSYRFVPDFANNAFSWVGTDIFIPRSMFNLGGYYIGGTSNNLMICTLNSNTFVPYTDVFPDATISLPQYMIGNDLKERFFDYNQITSTYNSLTHKYDFIYHGIYRNSNAGFGYSFSKIIFNSSTGNLSYSTYNDSQCYYGSQTFASLGLESDAGHMFMWNGYLCYSTGEYYVNNVLHNDILYAPNKSIPNSFVSLNYFSVGSSGTNYLDNTYNIFFSTRHFKTKCYFICGGTVYFTTDCYNYAFSNGTNYGKDLGYGSGYDSGYSNGRADGFDAGQESGYDTGYDAGYDSGYDAGQLAQGSDNYQSGYNAGYNAGMSANSQSSYDAGYDLGFTEGEQQGYADGLHDGEHDTSGYWFNQGKDAGYDIGYDVGYSDGTLNGATQSNNYTFLALMGAIVDAPVNTLMGLLDFEFFGLNMSHFALSLLSLALIFTIIRFIMVKK